MRPPHSRKAKPGLSALAFFQVFGAGALVGATASAQSERFVAVVIGEKGRDVCEVQYRVSDDDNWGPRTISGPPQAC